METDYEKKLLASILEPKNEPELSPYEIASFKGMLDDLRAGRIRRLSAKQRNWAEEINRKLQPFDASRVPAGRPTIIPDVLRKPLPLKPPSRR